LGLSWSRQSCLQAGFQPDSSICDELLRHRCSILGVYEAGESLIVCDGWSVSKWAEARWRPNAASPGLADFMPRMAKVEPGELRSLAALVTHSIRWATPRPAAPDAGVSRASCTSALKRRSRNSSRIGKGRLESRACRQDCLPHGSSIKNFRKSFRFHQCSHLY
jgi:hypothetical protein